MRLSPGIILRICFALLLATVALGLLKNLEVMTARPLLPGPTPASSAGRPLRFLIVAPQYDHPFWEQVREGARSAGVDLAVDVEFTGPRRASLEEQAQLLDMGTAAQVDGILTMGAPDAQIAAAIAKAVERGIPVVTVEVDQPGRRLAFVGSQNYDAGYKAGEWLVRRTGSKAVVGVVRGHLGPEEMDDRLRGFRDALAGHPGMRIAAVESSDMNRTVAAQKALRMLNQHPDLTAFYGTTALDVIGIAQSVQVRGLRGKVMVLGFDLPPEERPHSMGATQMLIEQRSFDMGRRAVELLEGYLRHDRRPPSEIFIPYTLVEGEEGS